MTQAKEDRRQAELQTSSRSVVRHFCSRGSFQLQRPRESERKWAIKNNLVPDPDARYKTEDAIMMTGTCEDMCAEYERHEREARR